MILTISKRMKPPKEFVIKNKEYKTNSDKKAYKFSYSAKIVEQQER